MLTEEVLPQFHPVLINVKIMAIAAQQPVAAFASYPVADIIAQNCPEGSRRNDQRNGETMGRPSIDGCDEQHGLARKGNARTLYGHKDQHRPVAVGRQKMRQLGCGKMKHLSAAFSLSSPMLNRYRLFCTGRHGR